MNRFESKVAVITGAGSGIGRATAQLLAGEGARIIVNDINSTGGEETVHLIRSAGGEATFVYADVGVYAQCEALIKATIEKFGDLHILVNNAGITRDALIMTMSEQDWDSVIQTNLKSTFACSRAAVRHMIRRRYGRIISMTSVAGQIGNAGQTNYSASKAGQIAFTKSLAREVASRNITVNAVAAGYIETDIWEKVPADIKERAANLIPMGRKGTPSEVAKAIAFLASDDASYITGHVLTVDGGMAMF